MPNVEELTRLKILEELAYSQQAEDRALDLTDFLTDSECFPRIRGPRREQNPNCQAWFPKRDQCWQGWENLSQRPKL